jgi:hypothetical protein
MSESIMPMAAARLTTMALITTCSERVFWVLK